MRSFSNPMRSKADPFRFMWTVLTSGYQIVEADGIQKMPFHEESRGGGTTISNYQTDAQVVAGYPLRFAERGNFLSFKVTRGNPGQLKSYNPMAFRALHRRFAEIEPTADSVLSFASEFGQLGRLLFQRDDGGFAEPIELWLMHVGKVRALLQIWDACKTEASDAEAKAEVEKYLGLGFGGGLREWFDDNESPYPRYPYKPGIASDAVRTIQEMLDHAEWDDTSSIRTIPESFDYRTAGLLLLREHLNIELAEGVKPTIDPIPGSPVFLVPRDLLGAIYALFAEETIGSTRAMKRCISCGKWFIPRHSGRITCSNACRQRHYRSVQAISKEDQGKNIG